MTTPKTSSPEAVDGGLAGLLARERPILFSAPMVRALLDGRKTQTRRVVKGDPVFVLPFIGRDNQPTHEFGLCLTHDRVINKHVRCPYGVPGDTLWVRESFAKVWRDECPPATPDDVDIEYRADTDGKAFAGDWPIEERDNEDRPRWRPSIHMPRWASRITLRVTEVRVERLNEISHDDCWAEGTVCDIHGARKHTCCSGLTRGYRAIWETINGSGSWDRNPWVWAVSFERVAQAVPTGRNIDRPRQTQDAPNPLPDTAREEGG